MDTRRHTKSNSVIVEYLRILAKLQKRPISSTHCYHSSDELLLREGKAYRTHHTKRQATLLTTLFEDITYENRYTIPKQCYANCQQVVLHNHTDIEFQYIEGYGLSPKLGIPIQHAFLVVDGKVFDPTWFRETNGIPTDNMQYYGVRICEQDLLAAIQMTNAFHSHLDNYWAKFQILKNKFNNNKPYLQ